ILPKGDGHVVTTKCSYHNDTDGDVPYAVQQVAAGGQLDWRRPQDGGDCTGTVTDAAGNGYYFMSDSTGSYVRSVDVRGQVRWTSAALGHSIDRVYYAPPTLGANGDVYFVTYNSYGNGFLEGFDADTGALTLDQSSGFPLEISAYDGGLV